MRPRLSGMLKTAATDLCSIQHNEQSWLFKASTLNAPASPGSPELVPSWDWGSLTRGGPGVCAPPDPVLVTGDDVALQKSEGLLQRGPVDLHCLSVHKTVPAVELRCHTDRVPLCVTRPREAPPCCRLAGGRRSHSEQSPPQPVSRSGLFFPRSRE